MINSMLIANRGEIAVRLVRACREMGIRSVVAYSSAAEESLAVRMADAAVRIGPAPARDSYLNKSGLISAAVLTQCDALHPGVGFLAENAAFAREVREAGLVFMGPASETIGLLGDKVEAKRTARENGVPVIPGSSGSVADGKSALEAAEEMGFPVIIKAAAGGGGKGMRIVREPGEFERVLQMAASEAESAFSDGTVYLEKYLENPRHVEVQILGDTYGNVVHLGERDCSVQEKHQKLVEESPSPVVTPGMRERMGNDAVRLFKSLDYVGAGTIEFLVVGDEYYFMEVNARVQVEHPVSELVTGVDIVRDQIRACAGEDLGFTQDDINLRGYAVECRINARAPGRVTNYLPPGGYGVRVDSFLYNGYFVPPNYDALIAKIICYGENRREGVRRMQRALSEFVLEGVPTNLDIQKQIVGHKTFQSGSFGTDFLASMMEEVA
ncbi:MAG: acetyl/propionyl/methylcrotonyl-CoA carboxylase subunit alpha [Spirochaetaceae bacterium]